ncbi:MAG TPA: UbiA family prenyltransferase [Ferruginibacter sp.]|nr:UbiA family prenyltransferase [Ferruginibacter sp.]
MKLVAAFFKMIRWPNLFFIALTQSLFYFCVFEKLLTEPGTPHKDFLFYLLVSASVMIAAAGYIINDYFDLQIDAVNKPQKVVVDKILKRRWAIVWHWILSGIGILLSFYISYKIGNWLIVLANIVAVLLLWFYSTTFKKKILSGNIIIAALTAWVIVVVYFFCGANIAVWQQVDILFDAKRFFKFTILYAGFTLLHLRKKYYQVILLLRHLLHG